MNHIPSPITRLRRRRGRLLIGGVCAVLHGVPLVTFDLDTCCRFSLENLRRIEAAVKAELVTLDASQRFLLAAYYLDHRTLAEIAKLQGVHESTISRKLERITAATIAATMIDCVIAVTRPYFVSRRLGSRAVSAAPRLRGWRRPG